MKKINLAVVSLGCAKNRIDTECMLGALNDRCTFVTDAAEAEIVLINTCSFINDAKQESIDTILDFAELKKTGNLKYIIVTGCLSEMFREELSGLLPEVDYFLGVDAYKDIEDIIDRLYSGQRGCLYNDRIQPPGVLPRVITTLRPTAYVKIAEGCDNRCSYCVIPDIRGEYQSRSKEDILTEVYTLVQSGYTEIVLIAQDTTLYGNDIYGQPQLADLLARVALTPGIKWVRVLYCYPQLVTEELIDTMLKYDTIVPYLDLPVQNFSDGILSEMNRRYDFNTINCIVNMVRSKSKDFILRTTLITGFPGETKEDFEKNLEKLKELEFDRLGVFTYSQEAGTPAGDMDVQVPEEEKQKRYASLMEAQSEVSYRRNEKRIGQVCDVLIEGFDEDSGMFYGRSYAEAPDADGKIFVDTSEDLVPGEFYSVEINYAYDVDLKGVLA